MIKNVFIAIVLAVVLALAGFFLLKRNNKVPSSQIPTFSSSASPGVSPQIKDIPQVSVLATNLEIPWALVFLPDNRMLFTERPGRVKVLDRADPQNPKTVLTINDVKAAGEGGLLGAVLSPNFTSSHHIFFYYTYDSNKTLNRVVRYDFDGTTFTNRKVIVDAIPGGVNHDGGRIKFGPDKFLYITAGDSLNPSLAQDTGSLAGKVLRVDEEGNSPGDNPFHNQVYSYGHRNPQGLTWDDMGRLWETEHGPSGSWPNCCQDEVNRIQKGANYGWPDSVGDTVKSGTIGPILHSGRDTWAPSGIAFFKGSLFYAGLRGQALFEAKINGDKLNLTTHFKGQFGRLRDVEVGPDGLLYVLTNNRDGRGSPSADDDKILVVNPAKL